MVVNIKKADLTALERKFSKTRADQIIWFYPKYEATQFDAWRHHSPMTIIRRFLHGDSLDTISESYNVPKAEVARVLKAYGVSSMQRLVGNGVRKTCMVRALPAECTRANPALGYLLGAQRGDGSIGNDTFQFSSTDNDFFEIVVHHLTLLGFLIADIKIYDVPSKMMKSPMTGKLHKTKPARRLELYCKRFAVFLREFNLDTLTDAQKIGFVNGFSDAEGCVAGEAKNITIVNTDRKLIDFVCKVLTQYSVHHSVHTCRRRYKFLSGAVAKDIHVISIGKLAFPNFTSIFKFSIRRKQIKLDEYMKVAEERYHYSELIRWVKKNRALVENLRASIEKASS